MLREVILKTAGMFDNHDPKETDYELWKSIAEFMDGETAWVVDHYAENGTFTYIGLKDPKKDKEVAFMMEQDSMCGCYINDREGFDEMWDGGEYGKDELFILPKENVIMPGQQEGKP